MKVNFTAQKLRNEDAHKLPKDVAQRDEIQEANRMKEAPPLNVFCDLSFQRQQVGEQIAMREQHAFRSRGRAGGENDFDESVFINTFKRVRLSGVRGDRFAKFIQTEERNIQTFG